MATARSARGESILYRQKAFVPESKQGAERRANELAESLATVTKQQKHRKGTAQRGTAQWAQAMRSAYQQAKRYAEALPEWPPFLIVCDVGYCFDVYADFSGSGKNYSPFPDPQTSRIPLLNLTKPETQAFLHLLKQERLSPGGCVMIEDSTENLRTAKSLGMKTVLVGSATASRTAPAWVDLRLKSVLELPRHQGRLHGSAR